MGTMMGKFSGFSAAGLLQACCSFSRFSPGCRRRMPLPALLPCVSGRESAVSASCSTLIKILITRPLFSTIPSVWSLILLTLMSVQGSKTTEIKTIWLTKHVWAASALTEPASFRFEKPAIIKRRLCCRRSRLSAGVLSLTWLWRLNASLPRNSVPTTLFPAIPRRLR